MGNNIFSGLENLGFNNIPSINLYEKNNTEVSTDTNRKKESLDKSILLYDKTITCPVCGHTFKARAVKASSYKVKQKDSDFLIYYSQINPYFYDVWLCNSCGYAAMKTDFEKIKSFQKDLIKNNITAKWHGKTYEEFYNIDIAIERYKLSLLNYTVMNSPSSKKAMNCLKLAWMYRINGDNLNEQLFLKNALDGFNDAFFNEKCPIYGMDNYTIMYLIGELNRRLGSYEEALVLFSKVITSKGVNQILKDKARNQKDLIKEAKQLQKEANKTQEEPSEEKETVTPKKGIFFFKFR